MISVAGNVKCTQPTTYCRRVLDSTLDLLHSVNSLTVFSSVWRGFLFCRPITHFILHRMKFRNWIKARKHIIRIGLHFRSAQGSANVCMYIYIGTNIYTYIHTYNDYIHCKWHKCCLNNSWSLLQYTVLFESRARRAWMRVLDVRE
jgi:hypothetical protein